MESTTTLPFRSTIGVEVDVQGDNVKDRTGPTWSSSAALQRYPSFRRRAHFFVAASQVARWFAHSKSIAHVPPSGIVPASASSHAAG
jgi:hypothetical protein